MRGLLRALFTVRAAAHSNFSVDAFANTMSVLSIDAASTGPMDVPDPFLFTVFHLDHYPKGEKGHLFAPRRGNGADFDWSAPYRMYHGSRVPGFPRHPHRGFETLTIVLAGLVDHADSLGSSGRYGEGDMQYVAARTTPRTKNYPRPKKTNPNPNPTTP